MNNRNLVSVGDDRNIIEPVIEQNIIEVYTAIGATGPQGALGPTGPAGTVDNLYYTHEQSVSNSVWSITHDLGWYPNITVVDSAGTVVEGEIDYVNVNSVVLTFSASFSGKAYLS